MKTQTLIIRDCPDGAGMARAADILAHGGIAVIPTETVYGIASHPRFPDAARRIYDLKGRDYGKPMQVLVDGVQTALRLAGSVPPGAMKLMQAYWPGPLTVVLPAAGGGTVGLRAPAHATMLTLLRLSGGALCATSANLAGMAETTDFGSALRLFGGLVDAAVDGGQCSFGVASTVVDCTSARSRVLRAGVIKQPDIIRVMSV